MGGKPPFVVGVEEEVSLRWLRLIKLAYVDATGRRRFWECVERTTSRASDVDAVGVVALVTKAEWGGPRAPRIVVIEQFRPPTRRKVLEMPAGLVDANEDATTAAVRELHEETGYVGVARAIGKNGCVAHSDPGVSAASVQFVVVDVNGDDPRNCRADALRPSLQGSEHIAVSLEPLDGLAGSLRERARRDGLAIDARLYSWAAGAELAASISECTVQHNGFYWPSMQSALLVSATLAAVAVGVPAICYARLSRLTR